MDLEKFVFVLCYGISWIVDYVLWNVVSFAHFFVQFINNRSTYTHNESERRLFLIIRKHREKQRGRDKETKGNSITWEKMYRKPSRFLFTTSNLYYNKLWQRNGYKNIYHLSAWVFETKNLKVRLVWSCHTKFSLFFLFEL